MNDLTESAGYCIDVTHEGSGAILDCAGHAITGAGQISPGIGVYLHGDHVTVRNCVIRSFKQGIVVESDNNELVGNTLTSNWAGFTVSYCAGSNFSGNTATGNTMGDFSCLGPAANIDSGNTCNINSGCAWLTTCPPPTPVPTPTPAPTPTPSPTPAYTVLKSYLGELTAIAASDGYVYFTFESTLEKIHREGGPVTMLATGLNEPCAVAATSDYVFWAEYGGDGAIKKKPASGGSAVTLASGASVDRPVDIALAPGYVFWLEEGGAVKRVSMDGGAVTTIAESMGSVTAIATRTGFSPTVYWTETLIGNIKKVSAGGGATTTLASDQMFPRDIAVSGNDVYWTNGLGSTVRKVNYNGGAVTTLTSDASGAEWLAVANGYVYWTTSSSLGKVSVNGGSVTTVASGLNGPTGICADEAYVYVADGTRILRIP